MPTSSPFNCSSLLSTTPMLLLLRPYTSTTTGGLFSSTTIASRSHTNKLGVTDGLTTSVCSYHHYFHII